MYPISDHLFQVDRDEGPLRMDRQDWRTMLSPRTLLNPSDEFARYLRESGGERLLEKR